MSAKVAPAEVQQYIIGVLRGAVAAYDRRLGPAYNQLRIK